VAAGVSLTLLSGLFFVDVDAYPGSWPLVLPGVCLLLLAVGAVTVEALWCVRPWAFGATALMVACYAALALAGIATSGQEVLPRSLLLLLLGGPMVFPMLRYLHVRSRQLWPRAGVRVPAARP
jgi:hypothetical protein